MRQKATNPGVGRARVDQAHSCVETLKSTKPDASGQPASEIVLAEICKNSMETIRVILSNYRGQDIINVRIWNTDADENLHPTAKGIACSVRHIPALREALERAEALASVSAGKGGAA